MADVNSLTNLTGATTGPNSQRVPTVAESLNHYFLSTATNYTARRIDDMLDQSQRAVSYLQSIQSMTLLSLAFKHNLLPGASSKTDNKSSETPKNNAPSAATAASSAAATAPTNTTDKAITSSNQPPANAPSPTPQIMPKLEETLVHWFTNQNVANVIYDSPFDRLDRAADLYTAYLAKLLRHGLVDSRATTTNQWTHINRPDSSHDRELLLLFQVTVQPGGRANYMTGLRVQIVGAEVWTGTTNVFDAGLADRIKILSLHPTRSYDLQDAAFAQSLSDTFALSIEALTGKYGEFKAQQNRTRAYQERLRFLTRIGKNASYTDAARHEFGWNFYPSNIHVEDPGLPQKINLLSNFQWPFRARLNAYLEGGARDCAARVLVPRNVTAIHCVSHYVWSGFERAAWQKGEHRLDDEKRLTRFPVNATSTNKTFKIHLPPFDPSEQVTSTIMLQPGNSTTSK